MYMTVKYDIPLSDFDCIPVGSEVKFCGYKDGFVVIEINSIQYYMSESYFEEVEMLIQLN